MIIAFAFSNYFLLVGLSGDLHLVQLHSSTVSEDCIKVLSFNIYSVSVLVALHKLLNLHLLEHYLNYAFSS